MGKFMTWLFWTVCYACRPVPQSLDKIVLRTIRTQWPWRKFRPSIWHNDDGKQWHICFTDEQDFTERRSLTVDCHIGMESGDIVGFVVWDEVLRATKAAKAEGGHSDNP